MPTSPAAIRVAIMTSATLPSTTPRSTALLPATSAGAYHGAELERARTVLAELVGLETRRHRVEVVVHRVDVDGDRFVLTGRAGLRSFAVVGRHDHHRVELGGDLEPERLLACGGERSVNGTGCPLRQGVPLAVRLAVRDHRHGQLEVARRRAAGDTGRALAS